jgi:hypothetical protein
MNFIAGVLHVVWVMTSILVCQCSKEAENCTDGGSTKYTEAREQELATQFHQAQEQRQQHQQQPELASIRR